MCASPWISFQRFSDVLICSFTQQKTRDKTDEVTLFSVPRKSLVNKNSKASLQKEVFLKNTLEISEVEQKNNRIIEIQRWTWRSATLWFCQG